MLKGIRKTLTTGAIVLMIVGMSGCSKDTSIVDQIADEQYRALAQTPTETNNDFNSTEKSDNLIRTEENLGGTDNTPGSIAEGIDLQTQGKTPDRATEEESSKSSQAAGNEVDPGIDPDIDMDLTKLSGTMVYSEVYNMMNKPEDYVGKTIKIEGIYYASYWEDTGKYYHCVLISDAAACCQNGIEFVWDNDTHVYPDEYPPDNTVIELTGIFGLYEENGETYCYLDTDDITVR